MKIIEESVRENVIFDYINNKMSLSEVAKKHSVSISYVSNMVNSSGYETRSVSEGMKQYKINEHFFEKIDTNNKSQILGFISADGCLCTPSQYSKIITIGLNSKDLNYLEWIKSELEFEGSVKSCQRNSSVILNICNQKICSDIQKLGIHERKSLTHQFPTLEQVPEQFIPSYILGYFDGDGHISFGRTKRDQKIWVACTLCCTKEFGEKLGEYLTKLDIKWVLSQKKEHIERNINAWSLRIGSGPSVCRFFDWIYNSYPSNKIMLRKYNKFKELRDLYDENYNFIQTEEWLKQRSERLAKAGTGRVLSEESHEKMRKSAQLREEKKRLANPRPIKSVKHHLSDEIKKEMVDYYINSKSSLATTGEKYGISAKSVQRIVQKMGLATRTIKESKNKK